MTEQNKTPAELRAEADAIDAANAAKNKGRVFISRFDGATTIHDGSKNHETILDAISDYRREATEAEVAALVALLPEFAAKLAQVRGEA